MKFKVVIRNILLTMAALLTLHLGARYIGLIMSPKFELNNSGNLSEMKDLSSYFFTFEKPNSADTVFIGSSHVYCGIDVNIMDKEYGINALMLSSTSQTLDLTYYAVMSAIEMQHPDTVFVECFCVRSDSQEQEPLSSRALLNDLPNWSKGKLLAAKASKQPMYYYLYPVTDLHNTWFKLTAKDLLLPRLSESSHYSFHFDRVYDCGDWKPDLSVEDEDIPDGALVWLNRIVQLCREENVRLVLFTAPYPADRTHQAIFRAIDDFALENGITYYNFVDDCDKVGIDFHTDLFDEQHLNTYGQKKLTRYIAENCMEF